MYLWNLDALITDLRSGSISQKNKLNYLLVFLLFSGPSIWSISTSAELIYVAVSMLLLLGGTVICYQANSRGDNRDFLDRYICLQVPLTIRFLVFFSALWLLFFVVIFGGLFYHLTAGNSNLATLVTLIVFYVAKIIYFAYLRSLFVKLAGPVPATTVPPADA